MIFAQLSQRLEDAALRHFPWFTDNVALTIICVSITALSAVAWL